MKFYTVFSLCVLVVVPLKFTHAFTPSKEHRRVLIEFNKPSLVEMVVAHKKEHGYAPTPDDQKAYTASLKQSHLQLIQQLKQHDITLIKNFTASINGVQCWVKKKQIHAIKKMPQIKGVRGVGQYKRLQNSENTPLQGESLAALNYIKTIGADKLHAQGFTGKGKTIAILDTGVNYYHKSMGGTHDLLSSLSVNDDPTYIEPGSFPNSKVIAGSDFGGTLERDVDGLLLDDADPDPISPESLLPDGKPDLQHGTMVAALAAGNAGLDVMPGVAPDAKIVAIKVFADFSLGFTDLVAPIEFALDPNQDGSIDDHVDVMNFSLGTDSGSAIGVLSERIALENAHALGVVVVAAAGNHKFGNVRDFSIATPSSWPSVISVGATEYIAPKDKAPYYQAAFFSLSGPDMINTSLKPDLSAPGVNIPFFNSETARGTSFSSPIVAGLAALLMQKYPDFTPDQIKDLMVNSSQKVFSNTLLDEYNKGEQYKYAPLRVQGVGSIQADKAFSLSSLASPSAISFGYQEVEGNERFEKTITIKNLTNQDKDYTVKIETNQTYDGVRMDVDRRVSVPANSEQDITLRMRVNGQQISQEIAQRDYLEVDGWVNITQGDETIRAGYLALIKPVSKLTVKPIKNGGVIISKNTIKSEATPYVAAQYQTLTYGNEINPEDIDVPNIGVKVNNSGEQPELEILVAYKERRSFAFIQRNPLTIDLSLKTESGEFNKHITLSKDGDFLNYLDPNFAFTKDETGFINFITVYNADFFTEALNGLPLRREDLTEQISVSSPIFSRHLVIKIPMDEALDGAATFNATVSTRPHLYRAFDFKAHTEVSFDITEHVTYESDDKGKVAKFERPSPSPMVTLKNQQSQQFLNYLWHLTGNSAADSTGYPSILLENTQPIKTKTSVLTGMIDVKLDTTFSIIEGAVADTSMQISNLLDVPLNISIDSFSNEVFPLGSFVTLLPGDVYMMDVEIDAVDKNKGDVINAEIILLREEDGYELGTLTYAVPVTDTGIALSKSNIGFKLNGQSLQPDGVIKRTIQMTNTLNSIREFEFELPGLIQTQHKIIKLKPNETRDLTFFIAAQDILNNTYAQDVINIKQVGVNSIINTIPVTVDVFGLPPQSFNEDVNGVVTVEGRVGEPLDMVFIFEMGTINPASLPLPLNVSSNNNDYRITVIDETFENQASVFIEVNYTPVKAGVIDDIIMFDLGAGMAPIEYKIIGNVVP